jgi:hypothetical protein
MLQAVDMACIHAIQKLKPHANCPSPNRQLRSASLDFKPYRSRCIIHNKSGVRSSKARTGAFWFYGVNCTIKTPKPYGPPDWPAATYVRKGRVRAPEQLPLIYINTPFDRFMIITIGQTGDPHLFAAETYIQMESIANWDHSLLTGWCRSHLHIQE